MSYQNRFDTKPSVIWRIKYKYFLKNIYTTTYYFYFYGENR